MKQCAKGERAWGEKIGGSLLWGEKTEGTDSV